MELKRFDKNREFAEVLASFDHELPLKGASNLHEIADMIHDITDGLISRVELLIRDAAIEAIKSGTEKITPEIILKLEKSLF